jgi:hypothetical protein
MIKLIDILKEAISGGLPLDDNGKIDLVQAIPELEKINSYIKEMGLSNDVIYRESKFKREYIINKLSTGDRDKYRGIRLGSKTVLDTLNIKDPVFASFFKGIGIFGDSFIIILKQPYKIYQSPEVNDLAVSTNPIQYSPFKNNQRSQTGTLSTEEEIAKGKELAKTYKQLKDIKPLPGADINEIIIDTSEYYMIKPGVLINLAGKHSGYQVKDAHNIKTYGQVYDIMTKLISYWKWAYKNKK